MTDLVLNVPMIDWFTVTSWEEVVGRDWWEYVWQLAGDGRHKKIMQYEGLLKDVPGGSIFAGAGEIRGKEHYMLYVSGAAADREFWRFKDVIGSGSARVSRIDVQVTIDEPDGWSQLGYMANAEEAGLKPTNRRSPNLEGDAELMTVYTGSRDSGRFDRCYQKESVGGFRFLRYETQFGRKYANELGAALARGDATAGEALAGQLARRGDLVELDVFRKLLDGGEYHPVYAREKGDKEKWLLNTVIPAIRAYCNQHDANSGIVELLRQATIGDNHD